MSATRKFSFEFVKFSPKSVARCLEAYPQDEVVKFLNSLGTAERSSLFSHLNSYLIASFLMHGQNSCAETLAELSDVHAAAVLASISEKERGPLLEGVEKKKRHKIGRLMSFIPGSAGSLMDSSLPPIRVSDTIKSCAINITSGGRYRYYIYLIDDEDKLIGVTTMRRVFEMKSSDAPLLTIMDSGPSSILVDDSEVEILKNSGWDKHHMMPVVDYQGVFLGIIQYATLKLLQKGRDRDLSIEDSHLTGAELGELYSLGFSAFLGGTGSVVKGMSEK